MFALIEMIIYGFAVMLSVTWPVVLGAAIVWGICKLIAFCKK